MMRMMLLEIAFLVEEKSTVALFDSVVPLPNFITLFPDQKKYRRAVSKNGIHEGV